MHCEYRFEVLKNANLRLIDLKQANIEHNFKQYWFIWENLDKVISEKFS
jgi:hypothetical protein